MSYLHISLDDTKGIFKVLSKKSVESIFDTRTLSFLRRMHLCYGTIFYLYCTCEDDNFSLEKVPEFYYNEFKDNLDWLKYGYHCHNESVSISEISNDDFNSQYFEFQKQIKRIAGQISHPEILRIHGFESNREKCNILRHDGVRILLTADDERKSYYLDELQINEINKKGILYDSSTDLHFVKSCTRLENCTNIILELNKMLSTGCNIISVFTHEWQMDREDIRQKFEICCKWGERLEND